MGRSARVQEYELLKKQRERVKERRHSCQDDIGQEAGA
jgi:propanediol dehydratase small subunit